MIGAMSSHITGLSIFCSTVCSGADRRKNQSSAPLAFERGIHRSPVDSPHKGPVTRKIFPFDDIIMYSRRPWHSVATTKRVSVTHLTLKPEYSGQIRSTPWLLMPWHLASLSHQQPWSWLHIVNEYLSSTIKNFNYPRHHSVEKWSMYFCVS